jgi:hypothetical protein
MGSAAEISPQNSMRQRQGDSSRRLPEKRPRLSGKMLNVQGKGFRLSRFFFRI